MIYFWFVKINFVDKNEMLELLCACFCKILILIPYLELGIFPLYFELASDSLKV